MEILHLTQPGDGCKKVQACYAHGVFDALQKFGAVPTKMDPVLWVRHSYRELNFIGTVLVDNIKVSGPEQVLNEFIKCLEAQFGPGGLKIRRTPFENCGVSHKSMTDGGFTMDQIDYINTLRPIATAELLTRSSKKKKTAQDDEAVMRSDAQGSQVAASQPLAKAFSSLLMATSYALLTRPDIAVFIVALQGHIDSPKIIHVKKLNAVVRWAQRHPRTIVYRRMRCSKVLETFSDASFKRESEERNGVPTGKANRGAVFLRTGRPLNEARLSGERTAMVHLLDWYS